MSWQVLEADCVEALKEMDEASVDAVVTDPPAGISFMGRAWDSDRSGGFVEWLAGVMSEALRVTKPGGHALVWALPRTSHWTGSAIEGAGWEIRDRIAHHFGSGFPKSHNLGNGYGTALKPATEDWWLARKPLVGTVAETVSRFGTGALNIDGCRIEHGGDVDLERQQRDFDRMGYMGTDGDTEGVATYKEGGRWPANVVLSHSPDCFKLVCPCCDGTGVDGDGASQIACPCCDGDGAVSHLSKCGGWIPDGDDMPGGLSLSCVEGCPVAELDRQSGELTSNGGVGRHTIATGSGAQNDNRRAYGDFGEATGTVYGDTGGASRFFLIVQADMLCVLCGLPCVTGVGNPSPPTEAPSDTAPDAAPGSPRLEPEGSGASSDSPASAVDGSSRTSLGTDQTSGSSAPPSADTKLAVWIVRLASSVAPLCKSCETSTARSVALWLTDPTQASKAGAGSTLAPSRQTLSRNLALIAAGSRTTGTIPTTGVLSSSFGSVSHAIDATILANCSEHDHARFRYQSKSSRAERNAGLEGFEERDAAELTGRDEGSIGLEGDPENRGQTGNPYASTSGKPRRNGHPTVKPVELMRWLVRLVTPPGGTVLDPFAGSGTTGIACVLEDFDFIGIEREAEYVEIAKARIGWWNTHKDRADEILALSARSERERQEHEVAGQLGLL